MAAAVDPSWEDEEEEEEEIEEVVSADQRPAASAALAEPPRRGEGSPAWDGGTEARRQLACFL